MDPRYRFIRSTDDPFKGLGDYSNSNEINICKTKLNYPLQTSFDFPTFQSGAVGSGLKVKLGYFFELLTQAIHGGRVKKINDLSINGTDFITSEPDVADNISCLLWESKAVSPGESLKLPNEQVAKYAYHQLGEGIDYIKTPRITYDIFRHGVKGLVNKFKGKPLEELVLILSETIKFGLSLPFSVIVNIHQQRGNNTFTSIYDGDKWTHCTRLLSSGLNDFLAYPKETLASFGLNPKYYNIAKARFPKNVTINGGIIRPFPILIIRDKNHIKWSEKFRKKDGKHFLSYFLPEKPEQSKDFGPLFEGSDGYGSLERAKGNELDDSFNPDEYRDEEEVPF